MTREINQTVHYHLHTKREIKIVTDLLTAADVVFVVDKFTVIFNEKAMGIPSRSGIPGAWLGGDLVRAIKLHREANR